MAAGEASQTAPVQILCFHESTFGHFCVLMFFFRFVLFCAILFPVRVLLQGVY